MVNLGVDADSLHGPQNVEGPVRSRVQNLQNSALLKVEQAPVLTQKQTGAV